MWEIHIIYMIIQTSCIIVSAFNSNRNFNSVTSDHQRFRHFDSTVVAAIAKFKYHPAVNETKKYLIFCAICSNLLNCQSAVQTNKLKMHCEK